MCLTCSRLAVCPHQVLALGHNHRETLGCWQIAERQQDLSNRIHSLQSDTRFGDVLTFSQSNYPPTQIYIWTVVFLMQMICFYIHIRCSSAEGPVGVPRTLLHLIQKLKWSIFSLILNINLGHMTALTLLTS